MIHPTRLLNRVDDLSVRSQPITPELARISACAYYIPATGGPVLVLLIVPLCGRPESQSILLPPSSQVATGSRGQGPR